MEKDHEKAFHYFALGAFDGRPVSLYKIGDMYLNGYYVRKNEAEAFAIFMRCLQDMMEETEDGGTARLAILEQSGAEMVSVLDVLAELATDGVAELPGLTVREGVPEIVGTLYYERREEVWDGQKE